MRQGSKNPCRLILHKMEDLFPICPNDSLLRASSVCEGACNHILLEDFVEIVGAGEADGFGNLIYWRVGC